METSKLYFIWNEYLTCRPCIITQFWWSSCWSSLVQSKCNGARHWKSLSLQKQYGTVFLSMSLSLSPPSPPPLSLFSLSLPSPLIMYSRRLTLNHTLQGNLEFVRTIEGRKRYSRFGHAMANLGDINGDGYDGKKILVPFREGHWFITCCHDRFRYCDQCSFHWDRKQWSWNSLYIS